MKNYHVEDPGKRTLARLFFFAINDSLCAKVFLSRFQIYLPNFGQFYANYVEAKNSYILRIEMHDEAVSRIRSRGDKGLFAEKGQVNRLLLYI